LLKKDRASDSNLRRRRFVIRIAGAAQLESDPKRRKLLSDALRAVGAPEAVLPEPGVHGQPNAVPGAGGPGVILGPQLEGEGALTALGPQLDLAGPVPSPGSGASTVAAEELAIQTKLDTAADSSLTRTCCSCMLMCTTNQPASPTDLARLDFEIRVGRSSDDVAKVTDPQSWAQCNHDYFKQAFFVGPPDGDGIPKPGPSPGPLGSKFSGVLFEQVEAQVGGGGSFKAMNLLQINTSGPLTDGSLRYRLDYGLARSLALNVLGMQPPAGGGLAEDCGFAVVQDAGSTPPTMKLLGTKRIRFPALAIQTGVESFLPLALKMVADEVATSACCGATGPGGSCDCPQLCSQATSPGGLVIPTKLCQTDNHH
jgi:hypothetical protein